MNHSTETVLFFNIQRETAPPTSFLHPWSSTAAELYRSFVGKHLDHWIPAEFNWLYLLIIPTILFLVWLANSCPLWAREPQESAKSRREGLPRRLRRALHRAWVSFWAELELGSKGEFEESTKELNEPSFSFQETISWSFGQATTEESSEASSDDNYESSETGYEGTTDESSDEFSNESNDEFSYEFPYCNRREFHSCPRF